jgi:hypothetical protein
VIIWLNWSIKEFSLECLNKEPFLKMTGRDIIGLGREGFLAIAPPFTGDILWEHLEILQKGNCHANTQNTYIISIYAGELSCVCAFLCDFSLGKL